MSTRSRTTRSRRGASLDVEGGWSRRRLLIVLFGAATAAVVLLGSLGYSLVLALDASDDEDAPDETGVSVPMHSDVAVGQQQRAEIAAAPMAEVPPEAMNPTDEKPAEAELETISVPSGVVPGPAAVLTGFPRTPEGAVGQLAAIESTVLQSMSLATAGEVYQAWALPGGAGPQAWPLTTSVRAFLGGAGMSEQKDEAANVTIEPSAAMVKGTDGPDWTLACALVTVTASLEKEVQIGYGYCERMQWVGGRWMIAPGTPPAAAPSAWPGSPAAVGAGWSTWVNGTGSGDPAGAVDGAGEF